jgi:uncharacterized protein YndB with AHSA1/START domain
LTGLGELEIERRLPAPIEEVFRWWTDPDRLSAWMSPVGRAEAEVDLRVGGELRIVMRAGDTVIEHRGRYIEVVPPTRLVFTWASPFTGTEPSLVTVELKPASAGETVLRLLHTALPEAIAESHRGGWSSMLERLALGLVGSAGSIGYMEDATDAS